MEIFVLDPNSKCPSLVLGPPTRKSEQYTNEDASQNNKLVLCFWKKVTKCRFCSVERTAGEDQMTAG
jgi:hypothetical protein